ncbi:MAG: metal dependent [Geobacteraceae bacterium]|nr:MAG: metal dependent [Geobacteraceae bacterium]
MQPLQEITTSFMQILRFQSEIRLGVIDGALFLEEHLFVVPTAPVKELADRFTEKEITAVIICRGVQHHELSIFVSLLARNNLAAAELEKALAQEEVQHIRLTIREEMKGNIKGNESEALETYNRALAAVRSVFNEVEKGRIPSGGEVLSVVKNLVTLTIHDHITLLGLAMIKDYDNYTFSHSVNVGVISMALGASIGLGRNEIEGVGIAGFLHDIGKTRIEKRILNKAGGLSAAEFEQIKKHPEYGANIVGKMEGINPQVARAVLGHHIRHNRQGYPEWARDLPFGSMSEIIAVADCYDAITTLRVYRTPLSPKTALDEICSLSGSFLDGTLVNRFVEMMGKYPVGTLVRLDNNEIAVVFRPNPADCEAPIVKIIMDANGRKIEDPVTQRLADAAGIRYAAIVAVVDPMLKSIDVATYLK